MRLSKLVLIIQMCRIVVNGGKLECCNPDGTTPKFLPKGCLPITIPQDDPGSKKRCLSIPRSADTSDIGCQIQPVRQVSIMIYNTILKTVHIYIHLKII